MKYINVFDKDTEYVSYRDGDGYIKPNVSLSRDTKVVHYNYPIWDTNGKPFVDLGLPSGTLWATMNVGASKSTDYGLYFQWGDTSGYTADQVGKDKQFNWANYKWNPSGDGKTFTRYSQIGDTLELVDDAAHMYMGGDWHMPTPTQIQELIDNTTTTFTTSDDGISGMTFTSKNGKSIFIPAAGDVNDGLVENIGSGGHVWSSMLDTRLAFCGKLLNFDSSSQSASMIVPFARSYGFSIRGVLG